MAVFREPPRFSKCPVCGYGKAKITFKPLINNKNTTIMVRYLECPKCGYKHVTEL